MVWCPIPLACRAARICGRCGEDHFAYLQWILLLLCRRESTIISTIRTYGCEEEEDVVGYSIGESIASVIRLSIALIGILVLVLQSAYARDAESSLSEAQVKSLIEDVAVIHVCSDRELLARVGRDTLKCRIGVSAFADGCWEMLDKLEPNYELAGREDDDEHTTAISDVFIHCMQAKWVTAAVKLQPDR